MHDDRDLLTDGFFESALFRSVQRRRLFKDSKTFVDCIPRGPVAAIFEHYRQAGKQEDEVALSEFVSRHFILPEEPPAVRLEKTDICTHIDSLWRRLTRRDGQGAAGSTLLALPYPYVVPGGRFREIYYWDSYFTMLGLLESGETGLAGHMVQNLAHLALGHGLIPTGNRSYYLSRSQPPCFALMVELLAHREGASAYRRFLPALLQEYAYWMDDGGPARHVVSLDTGFVLNRYHDRQDAPRPESWLEDVELCASVSPARPGLYREIRTAAESGWDFSSRWFRDGATMATIHTTEILPVDLNCLLFKLESVLAHATSLQGDLSAAARFGRAADRRKRAILETFWCDDQGFFSDFDHLRGRPTDRFSVAGMMPLFVNIATPRQAARAKKFLEGHLLKPGGLVTTTRRTGQQWDAPNGWAPLQWWAITGLENYGHTEIASTVARRWIALNCRVYARTGRLFEKYEVVDVDRAAGGGEYPTQDGFGWTNGVLRKLISRYGLHQ